MKKYTFYLLLSLAFHCLGQFQPAIPDKVFVDKNTPHPYYGHKGWAFIYTSENIPPFPGYDTATRILEFTFSASEQLIESSHASVHVNVGENSHDILLTRGIIIGNLSNRISGCPVPSIQVETFNTGSVYYNPLACKRVYPNRRYHVTLGISQDWVSYILRDDLGKIITQDAVNATQIWANEENLNRGLGILSIPDYAVSEVGFALLPIYPESTLTVNNIKLGYYFNN